MHVTTKFEDSIKLKEGMKISLDSIGLKYQTDKASSYHNYLIHYEEIFTPMRLQDFDMLEIGVYYGASIRMWHEYFPEARIVGVDVNPLDFDTSRLPRFTFIQGNQAEPLFLHQLAQQFNFRLVVDDGGHFWAHQIFTFQTLFPLLAPGSVYVCEDIQTSFGQYVAQYQGGTKESAAAYFLRLAQYVAAAEQDPVSDTEDALMHAIVKKVRSIVFIPHCVIVRC
jgi:cephalosporin hydroxylase